MATYGSGELDPRQKTGRESSSTDIAPLVGQVLTCSGYPNIALVDLGKNVSEALRASWADRERPFQTGGVMDSTWLTAMLGTASTGFGSWASSPLAQGNLFVATTKAGEKLMQIGSGFGSAVVKAGGITRHAPFIPVAAGQALVLSQASTMIFVAVAATIIVARLNRNEEGLGKLSQIVERMRQLMEAEDYARFETAAEQIDEIRSEVGHHGRFASDAKDRLSLLDRDVNLLRNKYGKLIAADVASVDDARSSVADLNRFYLASLHDVQVDVLQLCLALQEDATHVEHRQSQLQTKIERYCQDFKRILYEDRIGALHRKFKGDLAKSPWNRLPWGARELKTRTRDIQHIRKDFNSARARIERWMDAFESAREATDPPCIVFFRESNGEGALRAYYTSDLRLQPEEA